MRRGRWFARLMALVLAFPADVDRLESGDVQLRGPSAGTDLPIGTDVPNPHFGEPFVSTRSRPS